MSTYKPDAWVVLQISSKEFGTIYKILAGWGSSWKLSSGISSVDSDLEYGDIHYPQVSGSTYICDPKLQGLDLITASVLSHWQSIPNATFTVMDRDFIIPTKDYCKNV